MSIAMRMLENMDKGIVSHLLRHQDPRMIDHYAEYKTSPLKSMLDKVQVLKPELVSNLTGKTGKA